MNEFYSEFATAPGGDALVGSGGEHVNSRTSIGTSDNTMTAVMRIRERPLMTGGRPCETTGTAT